MKRLYSRLEKFFSSWMGAAFVLLLASWIAFQSLLAPALEDLERAERREQDLRQDFHRKQNKAVNLEQYKVQLGELEQLFSEFVQRLPDRFDTAGLQGGFGRLASANGVTMLGLEFAGEAKRDFYATREAVLTLRAPFPNLTAFFAELSRRHRVLTPGLLKLERRGVGADIEAVFEFQVFRYISEQEDEDDRLQKQKSRPGRQR